MDMQMVEEVRERLNLDGVPRETLIGIGVVLVVIVALAAHMLVGDTDIESIELNGGEDAQSAEASSPQPEQAAEKTLFVHVSGAVRNPGLCEIAEGARLADAIAAAGGFTEDAAMDSVNLARVVDDGEQIVVATHSQMEAAGTAPGASSASGSGSPAAAAGSSGKVNINTASAAELEQLPGIGAATAAKIVSDRQANGRFAAIEDLKRVSGVGDKKFDAISGLICV